MYRRFKSAAVRTQFVNVKSSLHRWGKKFEIPASFKSLTDFASYFKANPIVDTYCKMTTEIIEVGDDVIVAVVNEKLIYQLSKITDFDPVTVCCDATFDCMPKSLMPDPKSRSNQLLSFMIQYNLVVCCVFVKII